jgi:hypothetical protein
VEERLMITVNAGRTNLSRELGIILMRGQGKCVITVLLSASSIHCRLTKKAFIIPIHSTFFHTETDAIALKREISDLEKYQ